MTIDEQEKSRLYCSKNTVKDAKTGSKLSTEATKAVVLLQCCLLLSATRVEREHTLVVDLNVWRVLDQSLNDISFFNNIKP